jgi:protein TonB
VTQPILIRFTQPEYPPAALRLGREAVVNVRVLVDVDGRVLSAENAGQEVGMGFDKAAREAALTALYSPGTRDGVPAQMATIVVVRFTLDR